MEQMQTRASSYKRLYAMSFVVCMSILLPTSTAAYKQPGLEFKPEAPAEYFERSLIRVKQNNYQTYVDSLSSFLDAYRTTHLIPKERHNMTVCDYSHHAPSGHTCVVDIRNFWPCAQENYFNYHRSQACVFLKLKNNPHWLPEYYNSSSDLPDNMPMDLKNHIATIEKENPIQLQTVWVSCEGETAADVEFIGPVSYYPVRGFPGYYFPMESEEYYLSPLIAVHFERPQRGVITFVECKMWARNIVQDRDKQMGLVRFQLEIE